MTWLWHRLWRLVTGPPREPGEWAPGVQAARAFYQQPGTAMIHGRPHDRKMQEDHE